MLRQEGAGRLVFTLVKRSSVESVNMTIVGEDQTCLCECPRSDSHTTASIFKC